VLSLSKFSLLKADAGEESIPYSLLGCFQYENFLFGFPLESETPECFLGNLTLKNHEKLKNLWRFHQRNSEKKGVLFCLSAIFSSVFDFHSEFPVFPLWIKRPDADSKLQLSLVFPKNFQAKQLKLTPLPPGKTLLNLPPFFDEGLYSGVFRVHRSENLFLISPEGMLGMILKQKF